MSWWASKNLTPDGELYWERDIWDDLLMPDHWLDCVTFQKHGITFEEMDEIAGGMD